MTHDDKAATVEAPDTLTPAECDLRDFPFMQLDVTRLRHSDLAARESPECCWAAVLLWSAAWHQVPAASLPDDDLVLAHITGYSRCMSKWKKIRTGALHGFIKCQDGRLYHPVVAEKANTAWTLKLQHRYAKFEDRLRKQNKKRVEQGLSLLKSVSFEEWQHAGYPAVIDEKAKVSLSDAPCSAPNQTVTVECADLSSDALIQKMPHSAEVPLESPALSSGNASISAAPPLDIPDLSLGKSQNSAGIPREGFFFSDGILKNSNGILSETIPISDGNPKSSAGNLAHSDGIPLENALKREGEGEGEVEGEREGKGDLFKNYSVPNGTEQSSQKGLDPQEALFRLAVPWLVERGVIERSARSLLGAAVKQLGSSEAWQLAQRCMHEKPLEPAQWLAAGIQAQMQSTPRTVGRYVSKQAALEAHNREVVARLIAERNS